jgi:hypothetical protein
MLEKPPDLFAESPVFLPAWLPGEILYSWCARYHRLTANRLAADTSQQLFAAKGAGFWHDFPSHLNNFVERTYGVLGPTNLVACRHTMLGFYAPFRTEQEVAESVAAMESSSVRDLKFRLGLPASRIGAAHPLKACPACMNEDRLTVGVTYWHLEHQWPSAWLCLRHNQPLQLCLARNKKKNHLQWILPEDVEENYWWGPPLVGASDIEFLTRLARMTADSQSYDGFEFDLARFRATCLSSVGDHGWLRESGSVHLALVRKAFCDATQGISAFPGMEFVSTVEREDGGFVGGLLRHVRGHKHPVKYLLLICFLFDDWMAFTKAYKSVSAMPPPADPRRMELAFMVQEERLSISEAARRLNLPLSKAIHWANQEGVSYQRRPRTIDREKAALLSDALGKGLSCEEVARGIGIPLETVCRFRDNHSEIRELWKEARQGKLKESYRQRFLALLDANPGAPLTFFRTLAGSGYIWLYKHDREWLLEHRVIS